jgi:beta-lactamase regulating signal transducer with metallopeptidase domain
MSDALDRVAPAVSAWVLTFALHGTVLLGLAFAVTAWLGSRAAAACELVWRIAVCGPAFTATVQLVFVNDPLAGNLAWVAPAVESTPVGTATLAPAIEFPSVERHPGGDAVDSAVRGLASGHIVALAALVLASLGAARMARRRRALARCLEARRPLGDGALRSTLDRVCRDAGHRGGVRLSAAPGLASPVAFGVLRPEICVPERALRELGAAEARGMLAHELAHVVRRDPAWLALSNLLETLFPWQLLFGVARRRLGEIAELRCDAFAARLAGHEPVARCLVEVAGWWAQRQRPTDAWLAGMAAAGSALERRVDRLLERAPDTRLGVHALWLGPMLGAVLAGTTLAMPGVSQRAIAVRAASVPTDALPARVVASPYRPLLDAIDIEFSALRFELDVLRAQLGADAAREPFSVLLRELDSRVVGLERRRARLEAVLIARVGAEAPGAAAPAVRGDPIPRR